MRLRPGRAKRFLDAKSILVIFYLTDITFLPGQEPLSPIGQIIKDFWGAFLSPKILTTDDHFSLYATTCLPLNVGTYRVWVLAS